MGVCKQLEPDSCDNMQLTSKHARHAQLISTTDMRINLDVAKALEAIVCSQALHQEGISLGKGPAFRHLQQLSTVQQHINLLALQGFGQGLKTVPVYAVHAGTLRHGSAKMDCKQSCMQQSVMESAMNMVQKHCMLLTCTCCAGTFTHVA